MKPERSPKALSCRWCDAPLSEKKLRRHAVFCGKSCARDEERARHEPQRVGLSTGTRGAIAELRVGADLMLRGFEVFRALSPSCSCDLIARSAHGQLRVEVTMGTRSRVGTLMFAPHHPDKYDLLAIVCGPEIIYRPPPPEPAPGGEIDVQPESGAD